MIKNLMPEGTETFSDGSPYSRVTVPSERVHQNLIKAFGLYVESLPDDTDIDSLDRKYPIMSNRTPEPEAPETAQLTLFETETPLPQEALAEAYA